MVQNGLNDHFGRNDLIPNRILAAARRKWTKMVHFVLKRSILVHLGPPTVLWPFLNFGVCFQGCFSSTFIINLKEIKATFEAKNGLKRCLGCLATRPK